MISDVDRREAFDIGRYAVEAADTGSGSVAMQYGDGRISLKLVPLAAVAGKTQHMPNSFVAPSGNDITAAARAYLDRLKARPSFARVLQEARPYAGLFPLERKPAFPDPIQGE